MANTSTKELVALILYTPQREVFLERRPADAKIWPDELFFVAWQNDADEQPQQIINREARKISMVIDESPKEEYFSEFGMRYPQFLGRTTHNSLIDVTYFCLLRGGHRNDTKLPKTGRWYTQHEANEHLTQNGPAQHYMERLAMMWNAGRKYL